MKYEAALILLLAAFGVWQIQTWLQIALVRFQLWFEKRCLGPRPQTKGQTMNIDWKTAIQYAELVQIAGTVEPGGSYGQTQFDAIRKLGFTFQEALFANDRAGDPVPIGFIAVSSVLEAVAAIRGTDDIWEWIKDAEAAPVSVPAFAGLIHLGFSQMYASLKTKDAVTAKDYLQALVPTKAVRITICGHSLGSAIATLLAADLPRDKGWSCSCYTFASPRVGNHEFTDWYNQFLAATTWRVENPWDIVPNLPPTPPFEHVDTKFRLTGAAPSPDFASEHHITKYISLMESKL